MTATTIGINLSQMNRSILIREPDWYNPGKTGGDVLGFRRNPDKHCQALMTSDSHGRRTRFFSNVSPARFGKAINQPAAAALSIRRSPQTSTYKRICFRRLFAALPIFCVVETPTQTTRNTTASTASTVQRNAGAHNSSNSRHSNSNNSRHNKQQQRDHNERFAAVRTRSLCFAFNSVSCLPLLSPLLFLRCQFRFEPKHHHHHHQQQYYQQTHYYKHTHNEDV